MFTDVLTDVRTSINVISEISFVKVSIKVPLGNPYFEQDKFNKLAQGKKALTRLPMVSNDAFLAFVLNLFIILI